jgi:hypothetical protein
MAAKKVKEALKTLSISQLAFRTQLHRQTVANRLQAAGIEPVKQEKGKETLYEWNEEVERVLKAGNTDLDAAKLEKIQAEAQLRKLSVAEKQGELLAIAEVKDAIQAIIGNLHKRISVQMPKKVSASLAKMKSKNDVQALLEGEINLIFNELRRNHADFLE